MLIYYKLASDRKNHRTLYNVDNLKVGGKLKWTDVALSTASPFGVFEGEHTVQFWATKATDTAPPPLPLPVVQVDATKLVKIEVFYTRSGSMSGKQVVPLKKR